MSDARRAGALLLAIGACASPEPEPTLTNELGMEFVLIRPGSMVVGVFRASAAVKEALADRIH